MTSQRYTPAPSSLRSALLRGATRDASTCLTIFQGIITCPTNRPAGEPNRYSSVFTSKRLSSWSVPMNSPMKTRPSEVETRKLYLSKLLTLATAGESFSSVDKDEEEDIRRDG